MDPRHPTPMKEAGESPRSAGGGSGASPLRAPGMPPIRRGAMVARPWLGFWRGLLAALIPGAATPFADAAPAAAWEASARWRRRSLLAMIALATGAATTELALNLPANDSPWLFATQLGLFALLFAWVSAGCFTALMGFWVLLRGDRHAMSKHSALQGPLDAGARTAVVMPICNEDVGTVFAGLRASAESLAASGDAGLFDIFILSDSGDAAVRAAELAAWAELRDELDKQQAGIRVYYRWRQRRTQRKAGNVADFCRRWGRDYRYMVVLDADSVMSGDCLTTLVRLMEAHPSAGILQTAPQAIGHATVHARAQQFAARVTGRLFTAGMQFWQLGEAHYWGHNAIIRTAPFMAHCGLAPIAGRGALAGHILSHDFVEAALMRRAGFHVWLVHDLTGSYEQQPPHLLAELQRDRRWCQGNLQNAQLITEPGLHAVHRGMLATGAMAYLSAPLWLLYVMLGGLLWLGGDATLRTLPGALPVGIVGLWAGTLTMLVLPRLLGLAAVMLNGEQRRFGGSVRLLLSAVLEAGLSVLQAPLRMVAHTLFVVGALTGWALEWKSPPREAADVAWGEAARRFAPAGLLVLLVAAPLAWVQPLALLWLLPVGGPLLLAVPFTVLTSRRRLGERVRSARLLLVPEESWSPAVLHQAWRLAREQRPALGWAELLADARLCARLAAAMGQRRTSQGLRGAVRRQQIQQLALAGAQATPAERMRFLSEPGSLQQLRAATLFGRSLRGSLVSAA